VFVKCRHSTFIKELILKLFIKFEFKPNKQTRRRRRRESLPGKPGGTGFANRWHRFWAVCSFRCEGISPETPEISPEIPYFPETPEKSPEHPGFTNKIVLSGDFQDSPIHPPLGDINILSHPQSKAHHFAPKSSSLYSELCFSPWSFIENPLNSSSFTI
jgi:hypothetical protein